MCTYTHIYIFSYKNTHTTHTHTHTHIYIGFPCSSALKNPPAMQETLVQFLGQEDPLEKGMATHSSILAWKIPWQLYIFVTK